MAKPVEQLEQVIIRFAGDSGDGMQLTGGRFASETALLGNDLSTLPDFPAEIRAPAGSLPGVSGFQIHFSDHDILTPGDAPNVLVAMNPAALRTNLKDLPAGGTLILDADAFTERNLKKAGYTVSPLEDDSLEAYNVHEVPLTSLTLEELKEVDVTKREAERSKNMFALGLMSWLYTRPTEGTIDFLEKKFAKRPEIAEANTRAFRAGYAFGETSEGFVTQYEVAPAELQPGHVPRHHGQPGARAGPRRGQRAVEAAAVPERVPDHAGLRDPPRPRAAQELRHPHVPGRGRDRRRGRGARRELRRRAWRLHVERPGMILKMETIGLAVTLELPLLILDIQRAGPSTGMPTKPEQADLLAVMFGRNAESPVPVIAASTPGGLLLRGDRGDADRAQVPHPGLPALRRLPCERLRAVAAPGRCSLPDISRRVRRTAERGR